MLACCAGREADLDSDARCGSEAGQPASWLQLCELQATPAGVNTSQPEQDSLWVSWLARKMGDTNHCEGEAMPEIPNALLGTRRGPM